MGQRRFKNTTSSATSSFADIICDIKGKRTLKQFSEDTNVGITTLSRYLNGHVPHPSIRTLKKIIDPSSNPESNIDFEDLLSAAGIKQFSKNGGNESSHPINLDSNDNKKNIYKAKASQFELLVTGKLFNIVDKTPKLCTSSTRTIIDYKMRPDAIINIDKGDIKSWWFEIKYVDDISYIDYVLYKVLFLRVPEYAKLSIVVNSRDVFETLKRAPFTNYRGELSIILFNMERLIFEDEVYIGHLNMPQEEFYITDYVGVAEYD